MTPQSMERWPPVCNQVNVNPHNQCLTQIMHLIDRRSPQEKKGISFITPLDRGKLKGGLFCMRCNTLLPLASPLFWGKKEAQTRKNINKMTSALSGFKTLQNNHYRNIQAYVKSFSRAIMSRNTAARTTIYSDDYWLCRRDKNLKSLFVIYYV